MRSNHRTLARQAALLTIGLWVATAGLFLLPPMLLGDPMPPSMLAGVGTTVALGIPISAIVFWGALRFRDAPPWRRYGMTGAIAMAVAGVVTYDIGDATRNGIEGSPVSAADRLTLLQSVDAQLNKEAAGAPLLVEQLLPSRDALNASTSNFVREATEYYLTPRGAHPNARNRYVVTSPGLHMAYYPLEHMADISPRPVLLIAGEKAETRKFSQQAYDNAKQPKELTIIPGASHFDLYDKPQFVNPAIDKLATFFIKNL